MTWWAEVLIGDGGEMFLSVWPEDIIFDHQRNESSTAHGWRGFVEDPSAYGAAEQALLLANDHFQRVDL